MSKESKAYYDMLSNEEQTEYIRQRSQCPEVGDWLENVTGGIGWVMTEQMYTAFKDIPHTRSTLWKSFTGNGRWLVLDMFEIIEVSYNNEMDRLIWRMRRHGE